MAPMKEVAFAQCVQGPQAQGRTHIEKPVADVDAPCRQCKQDRNPDGEVNLRDRSEGKGPYDGDCRCIEAGQVPEAQHARGIELRTSLGKR